MVFEGQLNQVSITNENTTVDRNGWDLEKCKTGQHCVSLLGHMPEEVSSMDQIRAMKAVKNYKLLSVIFQRFRSKILGQALKKLEFIRRMRLSMPSDGFSKNKTVLDNVWLDVESYGYSAGYETEKHEQLLERIIGQFSILRH
jgi:hypothetical protein